VGCGGGSEGEAVITGVVEKGEEVTLSGVEVAVLEGSFGLVLELELSPP